VIGLAEVVMVGVGTTVNSVVEVPIQPNVLAPTTLYDVVVVGFAFTVVPVAAFKLAVGAQV